MGHQTGDCYIDVWRDADFRGETLRIRGPAEYPTLAFAEGRWGDDIGSLRVGPNAFVMAFRRRDFQDELVTFGPNDEVADLGLFKLDDDIESMRVIDSLKIFARAAYNSADVQPAPGPAPVDGKVRREPPNPHKRRRRPGRGR